MTLKRSGHLLEHANILLAGVSPETIEEMIKAEIEFRNY
jgi:hypothetical protein